MNYISLKSIILNTIVILFRICLYCLRSILKSINYFYNAINRLKNTFLLQDKFTIKCNEEISACLFMNINGNVETLYFPEIYNITHGGEIKVTTKGIQLYEFHDISFSLNSDFIRFNDQSIYCDKFSRTESIFNKFGDIDFIKYKNHEFSLIKYKKTLHFDYVFHMTGCFSRVWSHFLVQFYPKLEYLHLVPNNEMVTIILPNDVDTHIISLINFFIKDMNNINIIFVANDTQVFCRKVLYVSLDTWLSDDSLIKTLFHIQISDSAV